MEDTQRQTGYFIAMDSITISVRIERVSHFLSFDKNAALAITLFGTAGGGGRNLDIWRYTGAPRKAERLA
ncbi:hypothetical protein ABS735_19480 [Streptomyces sp. MMCC 100]|uniref:hypothetical protein n=1 Tax=Streptomyces sp. MMCC 100 TaxID=3163555 RepID=UPI003595516B